MTEEVEIDVDHEDVDQSTSVHHFQDVYPNTTDYSSPSPHAVLSNIEVFIMHIMSMFLYSYKDCKVFVLFIFILLLGSSLLMAFQDVAFLLSRASFTPHFSNIVAELKALGQPYVLRLCFGVSKGMLSVKYFHSIKAFFVSVEFHGDHKTIARLR